MKKNWPFILIVLLIIPSVRLLFLPGYFSMHDDLQVMRIFQLEKCLVDGQIPCRWAPDMAYGYGQAMFNFYSAFPYYLGALIRILTPLSIIATVKALFLISTLASAFGMYFLAREFWGKLGGILASVLYSYAPYHALDIFVRGALSESFALAILPFLWLFLYLLIKKPTFGRVLWVAFFLAALFTTHNVSSLMYAPFTIIWVGFWLVRLKASSSIKSIGLAGILGVGLSSFFLLPAIVEQGLIQIEFLTMDYLNYVAHFTTIRQLFWDRSWGFGPSTFGPNDDLSFQIGWPHWWLGVSLFVVIFGGKIREKFWPVVLGLLALAGFTAFLTHERSTQIWLSLPFMDFIQFPWRFLGLVMFGLAFVGGALALIDFKFKKSAVVIVIILTIILNVNFFRPQYLFPDLKDGEKLSGISFEIQQKSAILDYLPKTAPIAPRELAPENPWIVSGEGRAYNFTKRSNRFFFDAEIIENSSVQIPVMYFPGWRVIVDGFLVDSKPTGDYGVITISLPKGKHMVQGRFVNTPVRTLGNTLSVISALFIFAGYMIKTHKKKFLWL